MSISSSIPKERWLEHIKTMLKDPDADRNPVCIHKVSQILRVLKPEAYEPQLISLGPYHHCRDDLFVMEHYKLIASKMSQKVCGQDDIAVEKKLDDIVKSLVKEDIADILASYDRNLDAKEEVIAWMMMMDSIFLVQFLLGVDERSEESCLSKSQRTKYLLESNQSAYHSILKDIMKLENQIPLFVLKKIIKACDNIGGNIANDELLQNMLLKTCKKLSPLLINEKHPRSNVKNSPDHLLAFLYYSIVPEANSCSNNRECLADGHEEKPMENKDEIIKLQENKCFNIELPTILAMLSKINIRAFSNSKPVKLIIKIITCLPDVLLSSILSRFKQKASINDIEKSENSTNSTEGDSKGAPKVEEISIPSVSELKRIGVQFCPIDGPITICRIEFDKTSRKFYLPKITIDDNTDVIIRNLVAYEAQAISCPSYLARYTELMNGIIDTPEDVKLLREEGIIFHYLKKDEDVAELWNGMSRSIRLSHVPGIDEAIDQVNKYYKNSKKVRFFEFTKECMICGWRILMLFLALVLMVLMVIQSFCDVYNCSRALAPITEPKSS